VESRKLKGRARTGVRYQLSVVSKNKSKIQKQRLRTKAKIKVQWKVVSGKRKGKTKADVRKSKDSWQPAAGSLQEELKYKRLRTKAKTKKQQKQKRAFKCIWFLYSFAFTDN